METRALGGSSSADGIEIAVVGAHLKGMPLNRELVELGARFCRSVQTAPDYRLFALGGSPAKPGLLRCRPGEGAPVEAEIWTLPAEGFGRFVAKVPPPLSIGTLLLADGSTVKGFLAESEAVRQAPDISHFGGWRAYLGSIARAPVEALA
jgi:allophanate hydrolase